LLATLSQAIVKLVAASCPNLAAIRVGPTRTIPGLLWGEDRLLTSDQSLPAVDECSVVLSSGVLVPARAGMRDPGSSLAMLHLLAPVPAELMVVASRVDVGALAVVLASTIDGSPSARLAMIHRIVQGTGATPPSIVLDVPGGAEPGSVVMDADGALLGMVAMGAAGEHTVVPYAVMTRFAGEVAEQPVRPGAGPSRARPAPPPPPHQPTQPRRGWLGVALQPITVPDGLAAKTGHGSGRMVVSVTPGGPADEAGLITGDVLLALNGHAASGPHTFRAFLAEEQIGSEIEIKLLRDGSLRTVVLTIAAQPD
jgi:S1-C subfamily serine protease